MNRSSQNFILSLCRITIRRTSASSFFIEVEGIKIGYRVKSFIQAQQQCMQLFAMCPDEPVGYRCDKKFRAASSFNSPRKGKRRENAKSQTLSV